MNDSRLVSITQLREFLKVTKEFTFASKDRKDKYKWINTTLTKFQYLRLTRQQDKSLVLQYIRKMTGLSRVQLKRLVKQKRKKHTITVSKYWGTKNTFQVKYGPTDIALLVKVDNAHNRLNAFATKRVLKREFEVYGKQEFANVKNISVSRIYDLRGTRQYISASTTFTKTDSVQQTIGERKKPQPNGKPGFLRVDSVHQGDRGKEKGVYYINLIDEVLQWELVVCVEGISEQYLRPALETILECFPFGIKNFHSDNGSEYINYVVADMLNRMVITQTKSRSRHTNDNALVEGKNGSIVRKWFGRNHIPKTHASAINAFCARYFNTYLNFHRPCGYSVTETDKQGKQKKVYKEENYMPPYQKLKTLENWKQYLAPGWTEKRLDDISLAHSDTEFAELMQKARNALFKSLKH